MDPILGGMLGIGVASGIAQFMSSEKARKANQQEMQTLRDLYSKVQQPNFDPSTLTPKDYQVVQKYVPEVAPHVQEMNPTLLKETAATQEGKQAQLQALRQLQQVAQSPNNPELQGMSKQALDQAQAAAQSRSASLEDHYAKQGMLGSGVQLAAQLEGSQDAMSRAAQAGQSSAMEAYRQRLQALQGSAQLGGQISQQDLGMQGQNANIINQFNQRMAMGGQRYADYTAQQANQAQAQNLNVAQGIANQNVGMANQFGQEQQARQDRLKQLGYSNQMQTLGAQTDFGQMQMGQNNQMAQDRNQMYQGITNAGMGGLQYYGGQQAAQAGQQRADQRAYFNKYGEAPAPGEFGGGKDTGEDYG